MWPESQGSITTNPEPFLDRKPSPMTDTLDMLKRAIDGLGDTILVLESRLDPIMSSDTRAAQDKPVSEDSRGNSLVKVRLCQLQSQVDGLHDRVQWMIDRLDV